MENKLVMTEKELTLCMNMIYEKHKNSQNIKQVIADAVSLGMKYREEEIKDGINIVFKTIHNKNKQ